MVRNPGADCDRGKSAGNTGSISIGDSNRGRCAAGRACDSGGYGCEDETRGVRGDCAGGGRNAYETGAGAVVFHRGLHDRGAARGGVGSGGAAAETRVSSGAGESRHQHLHPCLPDISPMPEMPSDDPVEILVRLAKDREIDPWNIDIIEVTDKFLQYLEKQQFDLGYFGRTLHYAAILLRMKANAVINDEDQVEEKIEEFDHFDVEEYPIPEPQIRRRSKRPVTLDELISELKKAEKVELQRKTRKKVVEEKPLITTEDVLKIAHEENIEQTIAEVQMVLHEKFKHSDVVVLGELLDLDTDSILTYISLLFMATRKQIWLEQPELFGELYIRAQEGVFDV